MVNVGQVDLLIDPLMQKAVDCVASGRQVLTMHELLARLATSMDCRFLVAGEPVDASEVFLPSSLLPIIALGAQDAGLRLLQADFGCVLKKPMEGEITLTGARCAVPPVTGHLADITRALFFAHTATHLLGINQGAFLDVEPVYRVFSGFFESHFESQGPLPQGGSYSWPLMSPPL